MRPKTSDHFLLLCTWWRIQEEHTKSKLSQREARPLITHTHTRRVQFQRYTPVPLMSKVKDIWVAGFFGPARETSFPFLIHPSPRSTVFRSISSFFPIFPTQKNTENNPLYRLRWSGRVSHLWSGHDWQLQSRFREISIKCTSSHSAHRQHIEDSRRENAEARRHLFRASFTPNAPPNPQEERARTLSLPTVCKKEGN